MKILGIIPARGGSKGILGKNIKLLEGRPLLLYTADAVKIAKLLTKTIVSTDDEAIAQVAKAAEIEVPFMRPKSLAADNTPTLAVLQHALNFYDDLGEHYDAVCILQVTSPFRAKGLIDDCIQKFIQTKADTLISVREVPTDFNPNWVFFEDEKQFLQVSTGLDYVISQRQLLPKAYCRDGAIYIITRDQLLHKNNIFGEKITSFLTKSTQIVNIDTLEDWKKAEHILLKK